MTSELDIYRAANELIEQHGLKGASDHAADRIAELTERGDLDGAGAWCQIRLALQAEVGRMGTVKGVFRVSGNDHR